VAGGRWRPVLIPPWQDNPILKHSFPARSVNIQGYSPAYSGVSTYQLLISIINFCSSYTPYCAKNSFTYPKRSTEGCLRYNRLKVTDHVNEY